MFTYYWQELSFSNCTIKEIENHITEINNIISNSTDNDHFVKNAEFEKSKCSSIESIGVIIHTKLINKQLERVILPRILQRFTSTEKTFSSIDSMNAVYNKTTNAFLGVKFDPKSIKHITNLSEYKFFIDDSIEKTINGRNFLKCAKIQFDKIIITDDAIKMASSLGKNILPIFKDLKQLNKYASENNWSGKFSEHSVSEKYNITISDESDSVKQDKKLNQLRCFDIPTIGKQYCYLHIKTGKHRIYFYPNESTKTIYIPYIGKHLKTKKY